MPRAASALFATAFLLAGCLVGEQSPSLTSSQLPKLVLQSSDLPSAFEQFDEGAQTAADAPAGKRADRARFGRIGGWKARYRRSGSGVSGALVIESRADLFEGRSGAEADLDAYRDDFEEAVRARPGGEARVLPSPDLGDAAAAMTLRQSGSPDVRFFTVAWRFRNLSASVLVNGFDGRVTLADALALARAQQRGIVTAAG